MGGCSCLPESRLSCKMNVEESDEFQPAFEKEGYGERNLYNDDVVHVSTTISADMEAGSDGTRLLQSMYFK